MASVSANERLIVALDVPTLDDARRLVEALEGTGCMFKVGLELLTSEGVPAVTKALGIGASRIMYDAKFHDIRNTMAGATRNLAKHGIGMFTVHASAGPLALRDAAAERGGMRMLVVTVLTSMDSRDCHHVYVAAPAVVVTRFTVDVLGSGADGIVCSANELHVIRAVDLEDELLKVVPGIRPTWADNDDQTRVATPSDAISAGATHLVVGRPITRPPSRIGGPKDAASRILDEIVASLP